MAHIIEIQDFSYPDLDLFAHLTEAQLRNRLEPDKGIFIAESPKVIALALQAKCRPRALLLEQKNLEQAETILAQCGDIPVYVGERELLSKLTGYKLTRGILCAMFRPTLPGLSAVCSSARRIAVLEEISDAGNMGAIFRSAAALGMDAVIVGKSCCDPLCRRAVRVSMGTLFQIPWAFAENPAAELSALGFKTAAMALHAESVDIDDPRLAAAERLALFFGSEGYGLAEKTIAACDYVVKIPMFHRVDSLNVAAASAVAFWQLRNT